MKITIENKEFGLLAEISEIDGKLKVVLWDIVSGDLMPEWNIFEEKQLDDAISYARRITLMDRR